MSVVIQLDASALDRLFPEGSEARVELKAAVVNNFVDRLSIKQLKEIPAVITNKVNVAIKDVQERAEGAVLSALKEKGFIKSSGSWYSSGFQMSSSGSKFIQAEVENIFRCVVAAKLQELIEATDLSGIVEAKLGSGTTAVMRELISKEVDKALRAKFTS